MTALDLDAVRAAAEARQTRQKRSSYLQWLRKIHGWVGLWGALLGLLFGVTGFLMNHRSVMPIKVAPPANTTVQLALPEQPPANPKAMAQWLQHTLQLSTAPTKTKREPAKTLDWGARQVQQPEQWDIRFQSPGQEIRASYWRGNRYVEVQTSRRGVWETLMQYHRGGGASAAWVLLADTIAGSLMLLSLTGVLLWVEMNKRRAVGYAILAVSTLLTALVCGLMF